jgi:hypothetical protein
LNRDQIPHIREVSRFPVEFCDLRSAGQEQLLGINTYIRALRSGRKVLIPSLPTSTAMPTTMGLTPTTAKLVADRLPPKESNSSSIKGFVSKLRGYKPLDSTTTLVNPSDAQAAAGDDVGAHANEEAK